MTTPEYRIELLGSLRVLRNGQAHTHFRTHKTGALLAYLAACPARPARREELIELFWPDNNPASGRNCLRIALSALRQMLPLSAAPGFSPASPACVLQADTKQVWLDPDAYTTDKADFEAALKEATRAQDDSARTLWLKRALDLYTGDLLPGYDEQPFQGERQRLADRQQNALLRLVALLVTAKDGAAALDYANRAVHADPLRVEAHHMLIQLYVGMRRQEAALRQYHTLERVLAEHYNTRPSSALRALVAGMDASGRDGGSGERTLTATLPPDAPLSNNAPASPPPPRFAPAAPRRQGSLPVPTTGFFGQEDSLAQVLEMMDTPHTRLITLTGLGGSGKTRLAVQVGGTLRESLQDAVWFVPLAHLSDPGRILDAIAETLDPSRRQSARPFDQIVHALGHANALLILDNFEHLAEQGARVIPPLLEALPGLTVLITSRHRLNLSGEYEYAVQPLPTPQSAGTPERLLEFASVQLFVDRARAARSEFRLTRENATAIAALCRHLEGVPLAIELAAAYAQVLSPAQILARAARRLPLLVSRSRDATARHASLRAALDWSWQLLDPAQQRFFARLSVLRGGWTLDAAQSIAADASPWGASASSPRSASDLSIASAFPPTPAPAAPPASSADSDTYAPFWSHDADPFGAFTDNGGSYDAPLDAAFDSAADALLMLTDLRERSLIRSEDAGQEMRYAMLETLREFAGEQMDAAEAAEARQSHSRYFLGLAEQGEPYLTGPDASLWLKCLYADRDNLRAALRFLLDTSSAAPVTSPPPPATSLKEDTSSRDSDKPGSSEMAQAGLRLAGALWRYWYVRGYYDEGQEWLQKALALPAAQSAPANIRLKALRGLGNLALAQGHLERAQAAFEAHQALADSGGSIRDRASSLGSLAHVLRERGDLDQARALREESLCLFRQAGDERGVALSLANLAVVMTAQGEHDAALNMHRESLRLFRQLKDMQNVVLGLNNLALAIGERGSAGEARDCLLEALALAHTQDNKTGFVLALNTLAAFAAQRACSRQAATLFGCVENLLQQLNLPAASPLYANFRQEREQARAALGERDFAQYTLKAQLLSLEQMLELARDLPL